jgi:hypothetical protein
MPFWTGFLELASAFAEFPVSPLVAPPLFGLCFWYPRKIAHAFKLLSFP